MDDIQRILLKVGDKTWSIIQAKFQGQGVYGSNEMRTVEIMPINEDPEKGSRYVGDPHSYVDGSELLKLLKAELEGD